MILDQLAAHAAERVAVAMTRIPFGEMREAARAMPRGGFRFARAVGEKGLSFICEVKRASPSKGLISENFPFLDIARDYEAAGASCVSCLTEPKWFLGADEIFREIRADISLPMLRKDFTVHEYQLYEGKRLGADAILLICALLPEETLIRFLVICDELGLSALVEAHDEVELKAAVAAGAKMVGVNNRNLKDFSVDFSNAARLRDLVPPNVLFVAESGISSPADVVALKKIGVDAVLVGEALMRAQDRRAALTSFREAAK